jgi:hypothetical protein
MVGAYQFSSIFENDRNIFKPHSQIQIQSTFQLRGDGVTEPEVMSTHAQSHYNTRPAGSQIHIASAAAVVLSSAISLS